MKLSGGLEDKGIVVGNAYDKYGSRNPVVRWLMGGFEKALTALVAEARPEEIHEVGCGEGYWTLKWNQQGISARGSDFSEKVIALARSNAEAERVDPGRFEACSIYDLRPEHHSADLIVCCEVLEHLEQPEEAISALQRVTTRHLIVSVPREPLWRIMNMARGKYIRDLGNTPGHLQHWSRSEFIQLMGKYFQVVSVHTPLPWTMLLCHTRR